MTEAFIKSVLETCPENHFTEHNLQDLSLIFVLFCCQVFSYCYVVGVIYVVVVGRGSGDDGRWRGCGGAGEGGGARVGGGGGGGGGGNFLGT